MIFREHEHEELDRLLYSQDERVFSAALMTLITMSPVEIEQLISIEELFGCFHCSSSLVSSAACEVLIYLGSTEVIARLLDNIEKHSLISQSKYALIRIGKSSIFQLNQRLNNRIMARETYYFFQILHIVKAKEAIFDKREHPIELELKRVSWLSRYEVAYHLADELWELDDKTIKHYLSCENVFIQSAMFRKINHQKLKVFIPEALKYTAHDFLSFIASRCLQDLGEEAVIQLIWNLETLVFKNKPFLHSSSITASIYTLGELKSHQALDILHKLLLQSEYPSISKMASIAISNISSDQSIHILIRHLILENENLHIIIETLVKIGNKRAIEPLTRRLLASYNVNDYESIMMCLKGLNILGSNAGIRILENRIAKNYYSETEKVLSLLNRYYCQRLNQKPWPVTQKVLSVI